jgi:hypothetical protein
MVQLNARPAERTVSPVTAATPTAATPAGAERLPRDYATAPASRDTTALPDAPGRPTFQSFLSPLTHGPGRSGQW